MPFAFRKTHTSSIIWKFQHCAAMIFGQNFLLMENETAPPGDVGSVAGLGPAIAAATMGWMHLQVGG